MIDPISIAGLAFTATTVGSLIALHLRKVEVPRVGRWRAPPNIYIHPGSPVTMAEAHEARVYWTKLGFSFGELRVTHTERPAGNILITLPSQAWVMGAAGRAWWTVADAEGDEPAERPESELEDVVDVVPSSGLIMQAKIIIDPGLNSQERMTALRHEFGHALGFRHARARLDKKGRVVSHPTGHVMNPLLSKCGKGHRGIKP